MGVRTEADEHLDIARMRVREAIDELSEIVVRECDGTFDFTKEFCGQIRTAFDLLLQVRSELVP